MTIQNHEFKALYIDMARVLDDAEEVTRNLKGKKAKHLIEQDVRNLQIQVNRLDKHLAQLSREVRWNGRSNQL